MPLQQRPCARSVVAKQSTTTEIRNAYGNEKAKRNALTGASEGPAQANNVMVVRADKADVGIERLQCCRGSPGHWLQE